MSITIALPFKIEIHNIEDAIKTVLVLETYGYTFNSDQKIERLVSSFFKEHNQIIIYVNTKKNYLSYSDKYWELSQRPEYGLQYTAQEFLNYDF